MKAEKNILIAFILNLSFSIFEFIGGILSGSIAIMSDAIHDIGDAAGIGFSYFLERKSRKGPDAGALHRCRPKRQPDGAGGRLLRPLSAKA